jgi:hypothetical protein
MTDRPRLVWVIPRPRTAAVVLGLAIGALVGLHLLAVWFAESFDIEVLQSWFDLDREQSLPTWFSSVQLLAVGILLARVAKTDAESSIRRMAGIVAVAFVFFSIDEVATIHESITGILERFSWVPRFAAEHGIWIFVYAGLSVAASPFVLPGWWKMLRRTPLHALGLAAGAATFLLGGVGVEVARYFGRGGVVMEEALEMAGVALMLVTSLAILEAAGGDIGKDPDTGHRGSTPTSPVV